MAGEELRLPYIDGFNPAGVRKLDAHPGGARVGLEGRRNDTTFPANSRSG